MPDLPPLLPYHFQLLGLSVVTQHTLSNPHTHQHGQKEVGYCFRSSSWFWTGLILISARPKASTSKPKKQDPIPETKPTDVEPLYISSTLPPPTSNTPSQRRKSSIPEASRERSSPKRRTASNRTSPVEHANGTQDENIILEPLISDFEKQAEGKRIEGNAQFKSGKFTEAIGSYSEAIRLNSENPAYLANRAAALMSIRNYQSALADMQLANSPKFVSLGTQPSPKNIIRLVRCHLPLGQFYQARQALKNLLHESPDCQEAQKEDARLRKLEAILSTLKRDRDRQDWSMLLFGLDRLQKELDCGPLKAKEWLVWKVEALCGQKKWDEAKCICNDLVRSCPSDPEALYYRAKVMYSQGNLTATVSHCQEAMRCDPDFASARNLLRQARNIENLKEAGNASFKTSDYKMAIQKYIEAGAIDPTNESIAITLDSNRAQALLKSEQYAEAIKVCNKVLKMDKQHFKALRTRARAKKGDSQLDAAIADFEAASKIAPTPKDKTEIVNEIKSIKVLIARGKYVDHYKVCDLICIQIGSTREYVCGHEQSLTVLGVSRNASDDDIKKAFRKQSLIHHPDKGGNEERFKVTDFFPFLRRYMTPRLTFMFGKLTSRILFYKILSRGGGLTRVLNPDNPSGGMSDFYHGFKHDDASDQMPFGWDGLFGSAGGGAYRSHETSSHYRTHAHAHAQAHPFGGATSNPFFSHTGGFYWRLQDYEYHLLATDTLQRAELARMNRAISEWSFGLLVREHVRPLAQRSLFAANSPDRRTLTVLLTAVSNCEFRAPRLLGWLRKRWAKAGQCHVVSDNNPCRTGAIVMTRKTKDICSGMADRKGVGPA
ncbi:hypothetical protein VP01_1606g4 [Puccinia sorghi]|uniref:J domain-containing protein n=1 Tax=Puccinia sorghi TaxID=27349 RepID=A0A0L6VHA1_9BASI|nr:hypothetical protein VP01_1606g4 [Puccinia sorghi]